MLLKEHMGEAATNRSQFKSTREIGVGTNPVDGQVEELLRSQDDRSIDEVGKGDNAQRAG